MAGGATFLGALNAIELRAPSLPSSPDSFQQIRGQKLQHTRKEEKKKWEEEEVGISQKKKKAKKKGILNVLNLIIQWYSRSYSFDSFDPFDPLQKSLLKKTFETFKTLSKYIFAAGNK